MTENTAPPKGERLPRPLGITLIAALLFTVGIAYILSFVPLGAIVGVLSIVLGFALYMGKWWSRLGTIALMVLYILLNIYQTPDFSRPMISWIIMRSLLMIVVIYYLSQKGLKDFFISVSGRC